MGAGLNGGALNGGKLTQQKVRKVLPACQHQLFSSLCRGMLRHGMDAKREGDLAATC